MTHAEALVYAAEYALAVREGQPSPAACALGAVEALRKDTGEHPTYKAAINRNAKKMLADFRAFPQSPEPAGKESP